jgi:hypothetical protein
MRSGQGVTIREAKIETLEDILRQDICFTTQGIHSRIRNESINGVKELWKPREKNCNHNVLEPQCYTE